MSRLRRTGTGDLRPPYLGPYPDTTSQIRGPHLTCPGTSSSGTALFSSPLDDPVAALGGERRAGRTAVVPACRGNVRDERWRPVPRSVLWAQGGIAPPGPATSVHRHRLSTPSSAGRPGRSSAAVPARSAATAGLDGGQRL